MSKLSVLFVCTENICRSPLAQGIMLHLLKEHGLKRLVTVDSAGTHVSQPGHKPDTRAIRIAGEEGIKLRGIKARRIAGIDFVKHDHILVMDNSNYKNLIEICPENFLHKVQLIMEFAPEAGIVEVPDPYYGPTTGFKYVFDLIQQATQGFLDVLYDH